MYTSTQSAPTEEQLERDQHKMDDELHKVMQRDEVKNADAPKPHELKVQKLADGEDAAGSGLDEIYIDVRGNLHHRGDEAASEQTPQPKSPPTPQS
jgi:hypothetical protein